jgi:hypothetical protein
MFCEYMFSCYLFPFILLFSTCSMFELYVVVTGIVIFNILELIIEIVPNYPTAMLVGLGFKPPCLHFFLIFKVIFFACIFVIESSYSVFLLLYFHVNFISQKFVQSYVFDSFILYKLIQSMSQAQVSFIVRISQAHIRFINLYSNFFNKKLHTIKFWIPICKILGPPLRTTGVACAANLHPIMASAASWHLVLLSSVLPDLRHCIRSDFAREAGNRGDLVSLIWVYVMMQTLLTICAQKNRICMWVLEAGCSCVLDISRVFLTEPYKRETLTELGQSWEWSFLTICRITIHLGSLIQRGCSIGLKVDMIKSNNTALIVPC